MTAFLVLGEPFDRILPELIHKHPTITKEWVLEFFDQVWPAQAAVLRLPAALLRPAYEALRRERGVKPWTACRILGADLGMSPKTIENRITKSRPR